MNNDKSEHVKQHKIITSLGYNLNKKISVNYIYVKK